MSRLPYCDHCQFCAHDFHLVCVPHPTGPEGDTCSDFSPNLELESKEFVNFLGLLQQSGVNLDSSESFSNPFNLEANEDLWQPEGTTYYAGELLLQPQERWTQEEQLALLDTHPIFTGKCPACNRQFPHYAKPPVHWDCMCGWIDDTV